MTTHKQKAIPNKTLPYFTHRSGLCTNIVCFRRQPV